MRRTLVAFFSATIVASAIVATLPRLQASGQTLPLPGDTPASSFEPLATPAPNVGPAIFVDDVLAQANAYDNKPVKIKGVVVNERTDPTAAGSVEQFDLCGHGCIHVVDATNPSVTNGTGATVEGVFHKHFQRGRFSQNDVMLIIPGGVPPDDSQNWQRVLNGYPPTPLPN
jgi:hypothetical protein